MKRPAFSSGPLISLVIRVPPAAFQNGRELSWRAAGHRLDRRTEHSVGDADSPPRRPWTDPFRRGAITPRPKKSTRRRRPAIGRAALGRTRIDTALPSPTGGEGWAWRPIRHDLPAMFVVRLMWPCGRIGWRYSTNPQLLWSLAHLTGLQS